MNVSAHAGVTLKKNKQTNNQTKKYSKTNDERVHRYCSFRISSTALLGWISETRKKKKKAETAKVYTNTSHGAPPSSVQSNMCIFFRLCQTNEMKMP